MIWSNCSAQAGRGVKQMVFSIPDFDDLQQNLEDQEKLRCNLEAALQIESQIKTFNKTQKSKKK